MQVNNLNNLVNRWDISRSKVDALANVMQYTQAFVGDYKYSARQSDFGGWLKCDGRALDKTVYHRLYSVIGNAFGDSEHEFNLPNFQGRVPGIVNMNNALGDDVGAASHTLTVNQMPSHNHTGTTSSSGDHTHTTNANGGTLGLAVANGFNTVVETDTSGGELNVWTQPQALTVNTAGAHTHTFTTSSVGGGQAFSLMQPTLFGGSMFIYSAVDAPIYVAE